MDQNHCGVPSRPFPPPCNQFETRLQPCNTPKPLIRCPDGNKAERVCPIYPKQTGFVGAQQQAQWRTTYQNDFIVLKGGRPPMIKPAQPPWRTERQYQYDSVYREDYKPYCPEKRVQKEQGFEWVPDCNPMMTQTTYNCDYVNKQGKPARSVKKTFYWDPSPPPMDDRSSYGMAFVNHPRVDKDCKKTQKELQVEYGSWCCPFEGVTTYKKDYTPVLKSCPSQSMRPKVYMNKDLGKFDDRTVYRCAYEPFYYDDPAPKSNECF